MRVLFHSLPGSGHFHPHVPIARKLREAGHSVAFAAAASSRTMIERAGFETFTAGADFGQYFASKQAQRFFERVKSGEISARAEIAQLFVPHFAGRAVPKLIDAARRFRATLLFGDNTDFAIPLVGEKLGLPYASIQVVGYELPVFAGPFVGEQLALLRTKLKLAPDPELKFLFRYLNLAFAPPRFFAPDPGPPATTHYLRTTPYDQSGKEGLPEWAEALGDRPLIYASFGTSYNTSDRALKAFVKIADALRNEPVELVITTGRNVDPELLGIAGGNVHVERYIPQTLLFPKCDLVILHGGYSGLTQALDSGLPVILVPMGADQPTNLARCVEIGVARELDIEASVKTVRSLVRTMLDDPSYRRRARRLRAESQALPTIGHAIKLLETLERTKRPMLPRRKRPKASRRRPPK